MTRPKSKIKNLKSKIKRVRRSTEISRRRRDRKDPRFPDRPAFGPIPQAILADGCRSSITDSRCEHTPQHPALLHEDRRRRLHHAEANGRYLAVRPRILQRVSVAVHFVLCAGGLAEQRRAARDVRSPNRDLYKAAAAGGRIL